MLLWKAPTAFSSRRLVTYWATTKMPWQCSELICLTYVFTNIRSHATVWIIIWHSPTYLQVDFTNPKESAAMINKWFSERTDNVISDMLAEDAISEVSTLLLANTLYFTGEWHSGFNPQMTDERAFYVSRYKVIKTPFMFQRGRYPNFSFILIHRLHEWVSCRKIQVCIHWIAFTTSLGIAVRWTRDQYVHTFANRLQYRGTGKQSDSWKSDQVDRKHEICNSRCKYEWIVIFCRVQRSSRFSHSQLSLPKFKIEESIDLRAHLQNLGIASIFDSNKADLSGITGDKSLFVDKVLHKGVLEVRTVQEIRKLSLTILVVCLFICSICIRSQKKVALPLLLPR